MSKDLGITVNQLNSSHSSLQHMDTEKLTHIYWETKGTAARWKRPARAALLSSAQPLLQGLRGSVFWQTHKPIRGRQQILNK